jgi:hypothetical protein
MAETITTLLRNRTPDGRWVRPRPAGWKPPFHYSIHNRAFVARIIGAQHAYDTERAKKADGNVLVGDLDKALKSAARRYQKFCGNTSRYSPH